MSLNNFIDLQHLYISISCLDLPSDSLQVVQAIIAQQWLPACPLIFRPPSHQTPCGRCEALVASIVTAYYYSQTLYYSLYSSIVHGKYILSPSLLFLISPQITEKAPTPVPLSYYQVPSIVRFLFVQSIY